MSFRCEPLDPFTIYCNESELAGNEESVDENEQQDGREAPCDVYRVTSLTFV